VNDNPAAVHGVAHRVLSIAVNCYFGSVQIRAKGIAGDSVDEDGFIVQTGGYKALAFGKIAITRFSPVEAS
jgi:hypothetical protein